MIPPCLTPCLSMYDEWCRMVGLSVNYLVGELIPSEPGTKKKSMASEKDVEEENADKNILYDLTIHAEWKQENELFVIVYYSEFCEI